VQYNLLKTQVFYKADISLLKKLFYPAVSRTRIRKVEAVGPITGNSPPTNGGIKMHINSYDERTS